MDNEKLQGEADNILSLGLQLVRVFVAQAVSMGTLPHHALFGHIASCVALGLRLNLPKEEFLQQISNAWDGEAATGNFDAVLQDGVDDASAVICAMQELAVEQPPECDCETCRAKKQWAN